MQQLKTYLFFLAAFAFLPCMIFAQQAPAIQWQKCLGENSGDGPFSIIPAIGDSDSYVIAGRSGADDARIAKVGRSGIIWQNFLGGNKDDGAYCIIKTYDGGYAVAGSTASNERDVSGQHGSGDAWVVKLDSKGVLQWQKCFGGTGGDAALSIIETNDEARDLVFVGHTNSTDGDVTGWHGKDSNQNPIFRKNDVWVVRMSSHGAMRWQKCFGGTDHDWGRTIIQTKEGGFAISGHTTSNDGDVIGNHGVTDLWLIKLSQAGDLQWQKCLGGSGEEVPHPWLVNNPLIQTSDGGYAMTCTTTSNDGDVSGLHTTDSTMHVDAWVVKCNSTGSVEWQKCLGGNYGRDYGDDAGSSIIQNSKGDYIVAGFTGSNDGDVSGNHGNIDAWVVKLNKDGNIKWQHCYGGSGEDAIFSIIQATDEGYVFAGYTGSNDGDVTDNQFPGGSWIVKLEPEIINGVESADIITSNVKIYPNPSATKAHFSLNANYSLLTAGFYDIMGRQYFPNYTLENNLLNCDVHDLPSGIYIARLGWTSLAPWRDGSYPGFFTMPFLVRH
jgi:hypothetical protein